MDWPEILSGTLLALLAHAASPHQTLPRVAIELVPSIVYERFIDKNGWSWKDVGWRSGATVAVEITIHF